MPIPMSPIDNIPTVARGAMLGFEFRDGGAGYLGTLLANPTAGDRYVGRRVDRRGVKARAR